MERPPNDRHNAAILAAEQRMAKEREKKAQIDRLITEKQAEKKAEEEREEKKRLKEKLEKRAKQELEREAQTPAGQHNIEAWASQRAGRSIDLDTPEKKRERLLNALQQRGSQDCDEAAEGTTAVPSNGRALPTQLHQTNRHHSEHEHFCGSSDDEEEDLEYSNDIDSVLDVCPDLNVDWIRENLRKWSVDETVEYALNHPENRDIRAATISTNKTGAENPTASGSISPTKRAIEEMETVNIRSPSATHSLFGGGARTRDNRESNWTVNGHSNGQSSTSGTMEETPAQRRERLLRAIEKRKANPSVH